MLDMKAPIAKQVLIPAIYIFIYLFISCHIKWQMPNWWGKGWPSNWPALSRHRLPCIGHWQKWFCIKTKIVWQTVYAFIHHPRVFLFVDCLFEHRLGLATCTRFIQNLHTKLKIISTWLPRCIWRHGWNLCFLYGGPLLCLLFWMAVGV